MLDIGNGKVEELISYNQLLDHLETANENDIGMDQELFNSRAIIRHQAQDRSRLEGSKYNVKVQWETGEVSFDPLSVVGADGPVTCATYAKQHDLPALEGWQ